MEAAITTEFLKNIQTVTQRFVALVARDRGQSHLSSTTDYMQEVDHETRQYTAAIQAIRSISKPVCACESKTDSAYVRQLQKTISGLSEDIGDLNSRLSLLEQDRREEEGPPWISSPEFEFLSEGLQNEVVEIEKDTGIKNIVVHLDEVDEGMGIPAKIEEKITEIPKKPEPEPEEADEESEDAEEALELDEFTHNGTSYCKDADNNVYTVNEDGEVEETPIGRWLEKRQTIKLYSA